MAFPRNGSGYVHERAWGMVQYPTGLLPANFVSNEVKNTWWFEEAVVLNLLMPITHIVQHTLHTLFMEGAQIMYQVKVQLCDAWTRMGFSSDRTLFWCNATDLSINANCRQMLHEYMQTKFGPAEGRARYFYSRGLVGARQRGQALGRRLPRTHLYDVRQPDQDEQDLPLADADTYSEVAKDAKRGEWKITTWGKATQCTTELTRHDMGLLLQLQSLTTREV